MRVRFPRFFPLALTAALVVAVACTSVYNDQCTSLGGVCVTNPNQCGGSLPFACSVGVCCDPNGLPPGDASTPDVGTAPPHVDGSIVFHAEAGGSTSDAGGSHDASSASQPDVGTTPDSGPSVMDASGDVFTAPDSGSSTDASDASSQDAFAPDSAAHDAGSSCPGYSPPGTIDICTSCLLADASCQANGCYGGYYCHVKSGEVTGSCVKPSSVKCDGGA